MSRARIPSSFFVFVVVEYEGRVLVVRERKHGQRWYAPAGGLEAGEDIRDAAIRETLEEAGVLVEPVSILRVETLWSASERGEGLCAWWRFILRARPVGNTTPKSLADHHTLEARWVRPEEIPQLPLRHPEVIDLVAMALAS